MRLISILAAATIAASPAIAANCGGSFNGFVDQMKSEARAKGHSQRSVNAFFKTVAQDPRTLKADRAQDIFRMDFLEFSRRVISQNRMDHGAKNARKYKQTFDRITRDFGVPRGVLLAFWALETDYGAVQGVLCPRLPCCPFLIPPGHRRDPKLPPHHRL